MPRLDYSSHDLRTAVLLGLGSLIANLVVLWLAPNGFIPIGNLLVFLSAVSLGVGGGLMSAALGGVVFGVLLGDKLFALRILLLSVGVGFSARRFTLFPSYLAVFILWIIAIGPSYLVESSNWSGLSIPFLSDLLMSLTAGALTLTPRIWFSLTRTPRPMPLSLLLCHVITTSGFVAMFGAFVVQGVGLGVTMHELLVTMDLGDLLALSTVCLIVPTVLGDRLAKIVVEDYSGSNRTGMWSKTRTFSGLSSEYWRRQNTSDALPVSERTRSDITGTSLMASEVSTSKVSREDGICALSSEGKITFLNRTFRRMAGVVVSEATGRPIAEVGIAPALARHLEGLIGTTLARGKCLTELRLSDAENKMRFFEIASVKASEASLATLSDAGDGIVTTMRDITERRTLEQHLLQAQKLKSIGSMVGEFAKSFNSALTSITGIATLAKHQRDVESLRQSLSEITRHAKAASELERQLAEFAEGGPTLMRETSLTQLIEEKMSFFEKMVGSGCTITLTAATADAQVVCDKNLVVQLLTNLIANAKESYGSKGGEIEVSIDLETIDDEVSYLQPGSRPGRFVRMRIKDYGSGMTPETLSKAFEPLFTTKGSAGGSGLGLSVVFGIVRAHDGFLTIESQVNKGTTVSVYLPIAHEESEALEGNWGKSGLERGNFERVLVVEEEEGLRQTLSAMLSQLNYDVVFATSKEALDLPTSERFDIVLVDVVLPKMSPFEVIERLKEGRGEARYLVLADKETAAEGAADGIIKKPFSLETLATSLKASLDSEASENPTIH